MNPRWLVPISLTLGLGLLGLAGATKPLHRVELWLDQRDSPQTAAASALAPLIECVNRVDRDTRLQQVLRHIPADAPNSDKFGDRNEPEPHLIQESVCNERFTFKLELQQPGNRLVGAGAVYAYHLHRLSVPHVTDRSPDYLMASAALRTLLEDADLHVRPAQLARLEARFGRDLHWHLLNYMIAAREAVHRIELEMRSASLTPQTVATLTAAVQTTADSTRAYVREHRSRMQDEDARFLWSTIEPATDAYLVALNALHQDWLAHAPPQQLSDDYYRVTRRYDALLSYYNRQARNAF